MQRGLRLLTTDLWEHRRELVANDPTLQALTERVRGRVERVLREMPTVPRQKALLSRDGGICPHDRTPLGFDPWSPTAHRCPTCQRGIAGERHDRHWARAQHLWLAERAADLAVLAVLTDDAAAAERAGELLTAQAVVYQELPNQDNVLGPTHLFFSTYLESMWLTSWLAAAYLLRESGLLAEEPIELINQVAEEAASLIGDFNEGLSNRQVWNAAALTAIAAWFSDEELAQTAIESRAGLLGQLADGFEGGQGMWWEGENYHLFALRGMMMGIRWARVAGFDLLDDPELQRHFGQALLAPSLTALPDLTFPARKDSRFGVSLAQPAFLELWEIGRSWLPELTALDRWIAALYRQPAPAPEHYDAWLHDTGLPTPPQRSAADLSWWALLELEPRESADAGPFEPASVLIEHQGLAILRPGDGYLSLECGSAGGGHGHPDRLHLTLHSNGVHWLPDPGTASYVDKSLFWYRSARAHNAPTVDHTSPGDASCEAFDTSDGWGWARGRAGEVTRTAIAGPRLIVDLVELEAKESGTLELPWHLEGETSVVSPGQWTPVELEDEALEAVQRFEPAAPGTIVIEAKSGASRLRLHLWGNATLLRATSPGLPKRASRATVYLQQVQATNARLIALLELEPEGETTLEVKPDSISVRPANVQISRSATGVQVSSPEGKIALGGLRPVSIKRAPLLDERPRWDAVAAGLPPAARPALDGTLEGFDTDRPISLEDEHQYRRSEEPYDPERFAADAWVNWDESGFYLGVHVRKPELIIPDRNAAPLELDNELDDIHRDGIQFYIRWSDEEVSGWLVVPEAGGQIAARPIGDTGDGEVTGGWTQTDEGYLLSLGLSDPHVPGLRVGERLGFDLLINEMTSERVRRLGQLVWSGGGGWVYLRGDRQDPDHFGTLELL